MARIFPLLCWAAGFLAIVVWANWPLRASSPAVASPDTASMAPGEIARSDWPALRQARSAEHDLPVVALASSVRESAQDDPERLEQFLRRTATFQDDGSLRGVRVYPGWNERVFDEAGLEAGDLVVAVNGEPLNDPARASEVLDSLGRTATARITVERDAELAEFVLWFP